MQAVTLKDAKKNLPRIVEQVLDDAEPRILVTDQGGQVVMMPLDEFNSWNETRYLLASPANAAHLRRSIEEGESGRCRKGVRNLFRSSGPRSEGRRLQDRQNESFSPLNL